MKFTAHKKTAIYFKYSFIFLNLIFVSCVSIPSDFKTENISQENCSYFTEDIFDSSKSFIKVTPEIEYSEYKNSAQKIEYYLARINLQSKNLELTYFPNESDFSSTDKKGFFKSEKTENFAKKTSSNIAINANPFIAKNNSKISLVLSSKRKLAGIYKINGKQQNPSIEKYSALALTPAVNGEGFSAKIYQTQKDEYFTEEEFVFGGFFTILKDEQILDFKTHSHDARTAAGISSDGKYLFLLSVCGNSFSSVKGLSYPECARILKNAGCSDALEFDGGTPAQLYINGKIFHGKKSIETQGSSFGFKSK